MRNDIALCFHRVLSWTLIAGDSVVQKGQAGRRSLFWCTNLIVQKSKQLHEALLPSVHTHIAVKASSK